MSPLRAIAIDDEKHALDLISLYSDKSALVELVAAIDNPHEALSKIQDEDIDLVFLDIQMPELTGLQLLDLSPRPLNVIITSAYAEYALDGYKYNVCDYLLKPFSFQRFEEAVARVQSALKKATDAAAPNNFITLKGDGKGSYVRIDPKEILLVEGMRNYASFQLPEERVVSLLTLTQAEEILPANFMRVHRSYIVNLNRVERVEGHSLYVGKKIIPIGKTHREEVMKKLGV